MTFYLVEKGEWEGPSDPVEVIATTDTLEEMLDLPCVDPMWMAHILRARLREVGRLTTYYCDDANATIDDAYICEFIP